MKPNPILPTTMLLLALFAVAPLFGQVNALKKSRIFITGAVYDSETKEPLSNARFSVHKSENYATYSNGRFSLFGNPGDTISYRYIGYKEMKVVIPDTLRQLEYLMGVFMPKDTILIPEIIIFPRIDVYPSIINKVEITEQMMNQAQKNVNKAAEEGLTRSVRQYDASLNTGKTLRGYEISAQHKGLLVTPENSVGISTAGYRTHYLQFGSPIVRSKKLANEPARQNEIELILTNHPFAGIDTSKNRKETNK